jgi:ABC-2 type transport system permease protein
MKKIFVVARWEYVEKIKSKAFLIGLFVTPFLMVLMGVLPGLFATKQDNRTKVIGLIDQTGQYAALFADRMEQDFTLPDGEPNYVVEVFLRGPERPLDAAIAEANQNIMANTIDGYCLIRSTLSDDSSAISA